MTKIHLTAMMAAMLTTGMALAQTDHSSAHSAATTATSAAKPAAAVSDAEFVAQAAAGGLFEVQSSELATSKSESAELKAFAQQMIADHSKANQELAQLAQSKGLTVPTSLDPKHAAMMERLTKADGDKFNNIYGRMQVRAHQEAVSLFTSAAASVTDPDLKAFAAKTLPALQHHLEMTKSLPGADKAGKPEKAGKKSKDRSAE